MKHPLTKLIENGYTLNEIGVVLGVTKQAVFNYINNYGKPSAMVLLKILTAFQNYIKPSELLVYYNKIDKVK